MCLAGLQDLVLNLNYFDFGHRIVVWAMVTQNTIGRY